MGWGQKGRKKSLLLALAGLVLIFLDCSAFVQVWKPRFSRQESLWTKVEALTEFGMQISSGTPGEGCSGSSFVMHALKLDLYKFTNLDFPKVFYFY